MNRKRLFLLLMSVGVILILAACGSGGDNKNDGEANPATATTRATVTTADAAEATYQTLTIDDFADVVENQADDYQIINVHIPYAGEVANTDANIPYNDLDALTAAISDKDAPVILYCRSGNMSEQASRALVDQGYTNVWDVPGGMAAWQDSGRELLDRP